jgi:hypothetical protein
MVRTFLRGSYSPINKLLHFELETASEFDHQLWSLFFGGKITMGRLIV